MKPVTPTEVFALKVQLIVPDIVIQVFNELIAINFDGVKSTIFVQEILDELIKRDPNLTREVVISNQYLDIESLYENYGWKVIYKEPTNKNDYFEAFFCFTTKED